MTLSEHDEKLLRLGEAWKLAHEKADKLIDKFREIGYTGNCYVGFGNNADIEMVFAVDKEEEPAENNEEKTEVKNEQ